MQQPTVTLHLESTESLSGLEDWIAQVLRDALGEFIAARNCPDVAGYVAKRYADDSEASKARRILGVAARVRMARDLKKILGVSVGAGVDVPAPWVAGGGSPTAGLEELQGIFCDALYDWAERHGWRVAYSSDGTPPTMSKGDLDLPTVDFAGVAHIIEHLAISEQMSVQQVIREVNPRLRRGVPSPAAREAHAAYMKTSPRWAPWMMSTPMGVNPSRIVVGVFTEDGSFRCGDTVFGSDVLEISSFWPCDLEGNKVPWPWTKEGGEAS